MASNISATNDFATQITEESSTTTNNQKRDAGQKDDVNLSMPKKYTKSRGIRILHYFRFTFDLVTVITITTLILKNFFQSEHLLDGFAICALICVVDLTFTFLMLVGVWRDETYAIVSYISTGIPFTIASTAVCVFLVYEAAGGCPKEYEDMGSDLKQRHCYGPPLLMFFMILIHFISWLAFNRRWDRIEKKDRMRLAATATSTTYGTRSTPQLGTWEKKSTSGKKIRVEKTETSVPNQRNNKAPESGISETASQATQAATSGITEEPTSGLSNVSRPATPKQTLRAPAKPAIEPGTKKTKRSKLKK